MFQKKGVAQREGLHLIPSSRRQRLLWGLVLLLGILSLFAALEPRWPGDLPGMRSLQSLGNRGLDAFMEGISSLGDLRLSAAMLAGAVLLWGILRRLREALLVLLTPVGVGLAWALKIWVDRPRPSLEWGIEIAQEEGGSSFPSAHVVHITVFAGLLFYLVTIHVKRAWLRIPLQALLAVPILTTGASRVYRGAHWPSDVIGGYVLGAIGLLLLLGLYHRIRPRPDTWER